MSRRPLIALTGMIALIVTTAACTGGASHPRAGGLSRAGRLKSAVDAATHLRTQSTARSLSAGSTITSRGARQTEASTQSRQSRGQRPRPGHKQTTTIVRGGYVNDPGCSYGTALEPTSDPTKFTFECEGLGALWNGGFTGHTVVKIVGTIDIYGNISGTYDDWLHGTYTGDGTFGVLHFHGAFSVVGATQEFVARAEIVDGTCGFEGSSGSFVADGHSINGGYVAEWIRSATPPSPDPTCNPIDPDSLPLREQTS